MVIEIRKIEKRFIPIFKKFTKSIQTRCLIDDNPMKKAIEEIERGNEKSLKYNLSTKQSNIKFIFC